MKLRFTLRDLLWLIVVAAMAVAWWVDCNNLQQDKNKAISRMYDRERGMLIQFYRDYGIQSRNWPLTDEEKAGNRPVYEH